MPRPKRGEHSRWYNEDPITDRFEVLDLLGSKSPTNEPIHIRKNDQLSLWEIIVPWYIHGDSGGDQSGYHYLQIDQMLAEKLAGGDLLKPNRVKYHGGSYLEHDKLVLSEKGRLLVETYRDEQRALACSMLIPGTHTDLTGEIERRSSGREHRHYGELYFDFFAPDGICRVYPNKKEILYPFEG